MTSRCNESDIDRKASQNMAARSARRTHDRDGRPSLRQCSAWLLAAALVLCSGQALAATGVAVERCSDENPNLWGLRFNLGSAVAVDPCLSQCRQGGGNGYLCVSAVTGMCLCGTSAKPISTNPPTTGCNVLCNGTNDLCGGPPSRYSCYAPAAPKDPCPASPKTGCSTAKGSLDMRVFTSGKQFLRWNWRRGVIDPAALGDPTGSTEYDVCVYADDALVVEARVDPVDDWRALKPGKYRYDNFQGNADGITKIRLRGVGKKGAIVVRGNGSGLDLPAAPIDYLTSIRVQLLKDKGAGAGCWESSFEYPPRWNNGGRFQDKN